jgi:hypothetical protein
MENSIRREIYGIRLPVFATGRATHPVGFSEAVQIIVPNI